jgi:hypothetical protein
MILTKEYQSTTHPLPLITLTFTAEPTITATVAIGPPLNWARITEQSEPMATNQLPVTTYGDICCQ